MLGRKRDRGNARNKSRMFIRFKSLLFFGLGLGVGFRWKATHSHRHAAELLLLKPKMRGNHWGHVGSPHKYKQDSRELPCGKQTEVTQLLEATFRLTFALSLHQTQINDPPTPDFQRSRITGRHNAPADLNNSKSSEAEGLHPIVCI